MVNYTSTQLVRKMPPLPVFEERVVQALEETRSVTLTARRLSLPEPQVQRVAMMAYGLGRLEIDLMDY